MATIIAASISNPLRILITSEIQATDYTDSLYGFEGGCVAGPARAAALRLDAGVVRSDYFLSFTAPDVVCCVEILVGAGREPIEHEVLFRTQRPAEGRLK